MRQSRHLTFVSLPLQADQEMLCLSVKDALLSPEQDWTRPRSTQAAYGGAGSIRCLLFSGLDTGERSCIISALEARGLPRLPVTSLTRKNGGKKLGEVFVKAVQADRAYWENLQLIAQGKALPPPPPKKAVEAATPAAPAPPVPAAELREPERQAPSIGVSKADSSDSESESDSDSDGDGDAEWDDFFGGGAGPEPAWSQQLGRIEDEVLRRKEAGEDMAFLTDPGLAEPSWMQELLEERSLTAMFGRSTPPVDWGEEGEGQAQAMSEEEREEAIRQALEERDAALAEEAAGRGGGESGGFVRADGYATLDELMEAITSEAKIEEFRKAPANNPKGRDDAR